MNDEELRELAEVVSKADQQKLAMIAFTMLAKIHEELRAIRLATEQGNEPGPEDEPSPFQSLNG